jgi:hypothetical protein
MGRKAMEEKQQVKDNPGGRSALFSGDAALEYRVKSFLKIQEG